MSLPVSRHPPRNPPAARRALAAWPLLLIVACSPRGFAAPGEAAVRDDATLDAGAVTTDAATVDVVSPSQDQAPATPDVLATGDVLVDRPPAPADTPPAPVDIPPPVDVPPPVDAPPPPVDAPPPTDRGPAVGRGQYLDPCATSADCASADCLATAAGARWCTRRCAASAECGHGHLCGAGRCVPDDTGASCDPAAPAACARRCLANATGRAAHCTRECAVGADCPAGFACESATAGARLCVFVERGCSASADCPSGQCLDTGAGYAVCTSPCTADADCPRRMTIDDGAGRALALLPFRCQAVAGQMVCVPPLANVVTGQGVIRGNHALGESCATSGANNLCYSGVCDASDETCVQACTPAGGCPAGFACLPWQPAGAGTAQYLVCRRGGGGRGAAGATCARASDCASGACLPAATGTPYCTRYCLDGLCPTGMRCAMNASAFDGTALATCAR